MIITSLSLTFHSNSGNVKTVTVSPYNMTGDAVQKFKERVIAYNSSSENDLEALTLDGDDTVDHISEAKSTTTESTIIYSNGDLQSLTAPILEDIPENLKGEYVSVATKDANDKSSTFRISYINPNATDEIVAEFARKLAALSDNQVVSITRVKQTDISNSGGGE